MSKTLTEIYTERLATFSRQAKQLQTKISSIGLLRLLVFLLTGFLGYVFFDETLVCIAVLGAGAALFSYLVLKSLQLKEQKAIAIIKADINKTEIQIAGRDYLHRNSGNEFNDPKHPYCSDIDLFGKGSFFQFANRTVTVDGRIGFANELKANDIDEVEEKQNTIKELAEKLEWRQHFSALAQLEVNPKSFEKTNHWVSSYEPYLVRSSLYLVYAFSGISVVLSALLVLGQIPFSVLLLWFFIGLGISASTLKKTSKIYSETGKASAVFKQYYRLLAHIESADFKTRHLQQAQQNITATGKKAAWVFQSFSKILDAFDQRNNIVIAVFGNGLFLYELLMAHRVEGWIVKHQATVSQWFATVAFFDAKNALANFAYNHPAYTFPIVSEKINISAKALGHPLLNTTYRVDNDISISNEQFFIITGSNMAGKSTFLRAVSLSIVMANCGLPVCAATYTYRPIKLITSMRTTDSLADDASYFYSELVRLQYITKAIAHERYFIVLDEILKGTNSKDKAEGSKKFVEKLAHSGATGLIATHDVSLCTLAGAFAKIKNFYFDAEVVEDELLFDYTLKNGVCTNMNASFLLHKMGVV